MEGFFKALCLGLLALISTTAAGRTSSMAALSAALLDLGNPTSRFEVMHKTLFPEIDIQNEAAFIAEFFTRLQIREPAAPGSVKQCTYSGDSSGETITGQCVRAVADITKDYVKAQYAASLLLKYRLEKEKNLEVASSYCNAVATLNFARRTFCVLESVAPKMEAVFEVADQMVNYGQFSDTGFGPNQRTVFRTKLLEFIKTQTLEEVKKYEQVVAKGLIEQVDLLMAASQFRDAHFH